MNIQHVRQRLLKLEAELSAETERHRKLGAEQTRDSSARDYGDSSVADEAASEEFTEAELNSTILQQVRDHFKGWIIIRTVSASLTANQLKRNVLRLCLGPRIASSTKTCWSPQLESNSLLSESALQ